MPQNDDPFKVWNGFQKDDPFAPHNGFDSDNPFKPWNSPFGREEELTDDEARQYGIRRNRRERDDY